MHSVTFVGEVHQGRLHIGQPLEEFEGKQVLVTLIAPDAPLPSPRLEGKGEPRPLAAPEAEILEDTGRIVTAPRSRQTITAQVVAAERRPPRLSVEEE
jgi:hypothetical protein